jgi:hypothetical protein
LAPSAAGCRSPLDASRAALEAVRGAEVGIYDLSSEAEPPDCATCSPPTRNDGSRLGRVVGLIEGDNLVTIYVSEKATSAADRVLCDGVRWTANGVGFGSFNLQPLLQLALEETTARHGRFLSKR